MSVELPPWPFRDDEEVARHHRLLVHGHDAESRLEDEAGRGYGRGLSELEGNRFVDWLNVAGDADAVDVGAPVPLHGHVLANR